MHFQSGNADEEPWSAKLSALVVIAHDMTHVLAKKTFNTLAKLLHAINVALIHFPVDISRGVNGGIFG